MLGSPKALKKSVPSSEPTIVDPKRPLIQIPATRAYRAIGAPLPNAGTLFVVARVEILGGDRARARLPLPQPHARAAAVLGDELDASEFEAALSALRELVDHGVDLPLNVIEAMLELTGRDRSGVGRLAKGLGK